MTSPPLSPFLDPLTRIRDGETAWREREVVWSNCVRQKKTFFPSGGRRKVGVQNDLMRVPLLPFLSFFLYFRSAGPKGQRGKGRRGGGCGEPSAPPKTEPIGEGLFAFCHDRDAFPFPFLSCARCLTRGGKKERLFSFERCSIREVVWSGFCCLLVCGLLTAFNLLLVARSHCATTNEMAFL